MGLHGRGDLPLGGTPGEAGLKRHEHAGDQDQYGHHMAEDAARQTQQQDGAAGPPAERRQGQGAQTGPPGRATPCGRRRPH